MAFTSICHTSAVGEGGMGLFHAAREHPRQPTVGGHRGVDDEIRDLEPADVQRDLMARIALEREILGKRVSKKFGGVEIADRSRGE